VPEVIGVRKSGNCIAAKKKRRKPKDIFIGKERHQSQNCHQLPLLGPVGSMGQPFRQRVEMEVEDAKRHHAQNKQDQRGAHHAALTGGR